MSAGSWLVDGDGLTAMRPSAPPDEARRLIIADRSPAELARIVAFLNEQMRADVLAIELRHVAAEDGRLIPVPREIGQSERLRLREGAAGPPDPVLGVRRACGGPARPAQVWRTGTCSFDVMRAREPRLAVFERDREAFPGVAPAGAHGWPAFPPADRPAQARQTAFRRLAGWQESAA